MAKNKAYNKLVAGTMTAAMVAGVVTPAAAATKSFPDVPADHWAADSINYLVDKGAINGKPDGTFAPTEEIDRASAAVIMASTLNLPIEEGAQPTFEDAKNHWAAKYIAAVEKAGVIKGDDKGNFNPDGKINRASMASMLVNAYDLEKQVSGDLTTQFDDLKGHWGEKQANILVELGISKGTDNGWAPEKSVTRAEAAQFIAQTDMNYGKKEAKEAKVESVKALNATQVEVNFNKAVNKDTVIDSTNKTVKNINFTSLDGKAVENATGELSKDGKKLTITAGKKTTDQTQTVFEGRYDIKIDGVKDTDGKDVAKYEGKNIDFGKDTTAPAITNVEKVNSSTVKVHFSEPLSAAGNWSFKNAKGEDVKVTSSFKAGDSAVTLTIDGGVKAGTEITATVIGAKDQAGNLVSPNPTSVKFTKGDKDGVAPTVASVTAKGLNKFEIKFSEEVQGLNAGNIYIGGTALTTADVIKQDEADKTKYEVTLVTPKAAGVHKVEVKGTTATPSAKVTDLSGEELKDFSQLVEFKADTVAPKYVSSEVVVDTETKEEKLVLTFDKEVVQPAAFTTTAATELNKDLVTTTGTLTAGQLSVNPKNKKQLEVALKDVKFNGNALAKDATYTVKFAKGAISDTNTNQTEAFEVKFKRGADGQAITTAKPAVSSVTATNSNTVIVTFDQAVDGVTATNAANYSIAGLDIEKAVLSNGTDANGKVVANTVTLTLKKGTNTLNGDRDITIQNVKAKNGEVMDKATKTVANMKENVAPTVVSAKYSNTDADGKVNEITLTFSEAVELPQDAFNFFVGNATTGTETKNATVATPGTKEVKVSVNPSLDTDTIAKGITLKLNNGKAVADVNGNALDFTSIKATN